MAIENIDDKLLQKHRLWLSYGRIVDIHNNTYPVIVVINPIPIDHSLIIVEYL